MKRRGIAFSNELLLLLAITVVLTAVVMATVASSIIKRASTEKTEISVSHVSITLYKSGTNIRGVSGNMLVSNQGSNNIQINSIVLEYLDGRNRAHSFSLRISSSSKIVEAGESRIIGFYNNNVNVNYGDITSKGTVLIHVKYTKEGNANGNRIFEVIVPSSYEVVSTG